MWVCSLEEIWCDFDQPFRVNNRDISHVLLTREDKFMVDNPIGWLLEERGGGMNVNCVVINDSLIPFRAIFLCSMREEPCTERFPDFSVILHARGDGQMVAIHNTNQLFPDILCSLDCSRINEVLVTPNIREVISLPSFIHCQQWQMISILMIELLSPLIRLLLLILRWEEDILHREHRDDRGNFIWTS